MNLATLQAALLKARIGQKLRHLQLLLLVPCLVIAALGSVAVKRIWVHPTSALHQSKSAWFMYDPKYSLTTTTVAPSPPPLEIPVLGCMVVNRPDLLKRMLQSIDFPVATLVIHHNAGDSDQVNRETDDLLRDLQEGRLAVNHSCFDKVLVYHYPYNLGFSAGVNRIITATPHAPYWLIVNNDIQFKPGALLMASQKMRNASFLESLCLWGLDEYAVFFLTQRAYRTVGYFDENFWPAYGEDCDYTARLTRAYCPMIYAADPRALTNHAGSASWKTKGSMVLSFIQRAGNTFNNFDYLTAKWGVNVCSLRTPEPPYMQRNKGYSVPFNKTNSSLRAWQLDKERRKHLTGPDDCVLCSDI